MKTSTRRPLFLSLIISLALLLGQCQPVPKPFAASHKGDFSAIQIGPRAGLIIEPIAGMADAAFAQAMAQAMAGALGRRDITASTGKGHRRSHRLRGEVALSPTGQLRLTWHLATAEKAEILTATVTEKVDPAKWRRGDAPLRQRLAEKSADAIDQELRHMERGQGRRIALAAVTLGPMDGIPGRGSDDLAKAMTAALTKAGVPLADSPRDDAFILLGSMHVTKAATGLRRIEVIWHLIRPDGREFGKISQANNVPVDQLSGNWPALAQAIAQAGAPGVRDLLRRDTGG
ncbi:MAG: hypothetical protein HN394_13645 [Rhodospirillaceae bacterium]|nr:hypothetical protein [Rhodospirillaceae bacterium]MBT7666818.1 hypothetical protein [Rhodospirillaceae bacterium]